MEAQDLHPDHQYTRAEVARFLGVAPKTVSNQPQDLLPRTRGRFRGIDVMAYRGDITYAEAAAYKRARRQQVLRLVKPAA